MRNDSKRTLTPKLRFPEFRDKPGWEEKPLKKLAAPINERVGTAKCMPYTVTSGVGLVSQQEKFGRSIAGNSFKNYVRLKKNDFAYNKSATKAFPQGYIARYLGDDAAAVPKSIFTCFRVDENEVDPAYLDYLFAGNLHGKWLRRFLTIGARAHGSLNVDDDDLLSLPVPLPGGRSSSAEQKKIANCLCSVDELITAEGRKLGALRAHKKGLMQQLFPRPGETRPRLRFPEFRHAPEWEDRTIVLACELKAGDFVSASEIAEHFEDGLFPCYGGNGLRGYVKSFTHDGRYVLVGRQGALCGNVNLFSGKFHATEHALVATPKPKVDTGWLFYAMDVLTLNRFSIGQAQPGLSVTVLNGVSIAVPPEEDEQKEIANCLSWLDDQIAAETRKIAVLKTHKTGLMQQLFPPSEETEA